MVIDDNFGGKCEDEKMTDYDSSYMQVQFPRISQAEARLKNDLVEFENKRMTTKQFKVTLSNVIIGEDEQSFLMLCEFAGLFTILIKIKEDYPFSYPDITYHSGAYLDLFEYNCKIKLPFLTKEKWSPVLSLNSILFSIELLLLGQNNVNFSQLIGSNGIEETTRTYSVMDDMIEQHRNSKRKKKHCEYLEENKEYMTPEYYYTEAGEQMYINNDIVHKMKRIKLCLTN